MTAHTKVDAVTSLVVDARRAWLAVAAVLLMLVALKVVTAFLGLAGAVAGAVVTLGVLGVTRAGRATWHDLGMSRRSLRRGAIWAGGIAAIALSGFALVAAAAAALPPVADWLSSLTVADVDPNTALLRILVIIPLGTVLVEEVAFRGALPALIQRTGATTRSAISTAAVLFGLWHIVPSLEAAQSNATPGSPVWPAVAATVVFTTVSGLVLGYLRHRTGSILAPMAVHMATNSLGVCLLWFLTVGVLN